VNDKSGGAAIAAIVAALLRSGVAVVRDFLPDQEIAALRDEARRRDALGELHPAGVGRAGTRILRDDIRGDRILWLDEVDPATAERALHVALESLRMAVNRELALGLWSFEAHYALYPPGAHYARHRDRFHDDDSRVVSCVLYLNEGWRAGDGGALRLHLDHGETRDVLPDGGTLVAFLSARFEHEVLPATRPRLAVAGWFRTRDS
jgi:SM-20-related protein